MCEDRGFAEGISCEACRVTIRAPHERELREQWQHQHERVHEVEHESLQIAKGEINRRLDEMNNLRLQITAERGEFLGRDAYDREHNVLRDQLDGRIKVLETVNANLQGRMWMMGAVISLFLSLLTLALHFWK